MNNENVLEDTNNQSDAQVTRSTPVEHLYIELDNDLMAKPKALSAFILTKNKPAVMVFCNSPSEADMVEALLRKEGINTDKLIGRVPHAKVLKAIQDTQAGNITAIVITDVAARDLHGIDLDYIINYSIHENPEIYLHRTTGSEQTNRLKAVISLVSAADFANFHYLKKCVEFEINKTDLPSNDEVAILRSDNIITQILKKATECDPSSVELANKILGHSNKAEILAVLVQNFLTPTAATNNYSTRNYRGRSSSDSGYERKPIRPAKKDLRYYLGYGKNNDFNETKFKALLASGSNQFDANLIKRINVRADYSFTDIAEENVSDFESALNSINYGEGKFKFHKATHIPLPRENEDEAEE